MRYALRRLRSAPLFTLTTVLTVALAIGSASAVFSAVNPILFEPLPYPDARRIAMLWEAGRDGGRSEGSFGMSSALAERSRAFEAIAAIKAWQPTITGANVRIRRAVAFPRVPPTRRRPFGGAAHLLPTVSGTRRRELASAVRRPPLLIRGESP